MTGDPTVKIDAFCHIMPRPYYDRFFTLDETIHAANLRQRVANIPCLVDMDVRFAQMDEFGDYRQLINICAPPVEDLGSPEISRRMARIGNEALAELVRSHPDRFAGFCACVPMDDPDAAVAELEYATRELGAVGAQIYTHVHGEAMDAARFDPFYSAAAASGSLCRSTRAAARRGPTTPPSGGHAMRSGGPSAGSTTCRPSWPGSCSPGCWSGTRISSC
jgi:predicted TIM-barrel fold metal-dependent hydrolase